MIERPILFSGPISCLCWNLEDEQLWRFGTVELAEILRGKVAE